MNNKNIKLEKAEKPARYAGGEINHVEKQSAELDFALCFPDVYEVGMSHLGIQILYEALNSIPWIYAQRAFCPWVDMAEQLREKDLPLVSLEKKKPLCDFDIVGFNLSYEMCYSNVLMMLELGKIPLLAAQRSANAPIVIGGGACTVNPEPVADFFDLFVIGEGEEVAPEICRLYREHKKTGFDRSAFLRAAAQIPGVYVPSLYEVRYLPEGTIETVKPKEDAPAKVRRRYIRDFEHAAAVTKPVLPYINTVHDRCVLEIMRGCPNGCRFCQAGYMTRPVRQRSAETLLAQAESIISSTGYDEISLCSLSSGDHKEIIPLIESLIERYQKQRISVSLPSLRASNFAFAEQLQQVRKSGLTFAPEAGTQRLRDVINKNISEQEIEQTMRRAFNSGVSTVKLYFMIGLPTEKTEDIDGIASLVQRIREIYYETPKENRGGRLQINVSASCFVPKPGTPFEWTAMEDISKLQEKQYYLKDKLRMRGVKFTYHDAKVSFLEAVFARGDRRLSAVLLQSYKNGTMFDAWQEHFKFDVYKKAFEDHGIDPAFYANRERNLEETLPWDHIDGLIEKDFLAREYNKALQTATSPVCGKGCGMCGLQNECGLRKGEDA